MALLEERSFPVKKLILLASHRSAGRVQTFCGTELRVEETTKESFENVDLILASAGKFFVIGINNFDKYILLQIFS